MSHPRREDLLRFANDASGGDQVVAAHLRDCEPCADETARLRSVIDIVRARAIVDAAPTPDCLDDATVAALVAGNDLGVERERVVRHVASCAFCRQRVAAVTRGLADPEIAAEIAATESVKSTRRLAPRFTIPFAAAAAAVLLFLALPRHEGAPDRAHRALPTRQSSPVLLSPLGVVAEAKALRWGSVAGANGYRVTLLDAQGDVLYEAQTADTSLRVPDTVVLVPGRRYSWEAAARVGWERWEESKFGSFSIGSGGRP